MVATADKNLKNSLMREGSHLKYTRSYGGAGAGLMALGFCLAICFSMLGAMLFFMDMMFQGIVLITGSCVFGSVLVVIGLLLKIKRTNKYMEYYVSKSEYPKEMLEEFDREFADGNVILCSPSRTLSTTGKREAAIITDHWFQQPYMLPMKYSGLYRVEDIVAIFYEQKPNIKGEIFDPLLFTVTRNGEGYYYRSYSPEFSETIIREIAKRNPGVITVRHITVDGRNYDCATQAEEVAALFRAACEKSE